MIATQENEIWRTIPPEEKFAMIARAQSSGLMAAVMNFIALTSIAVGLQQNWLIWAALAMSPLIFQFVAGKAWRKLRPKTMLEYLAARSVARRFAFTCNARDLSIALIFRGKLEEMFAPDEIQEQLNSMIESNREAEVWIALFQDAIVMMTEGEGGASLVLAHQINDRVSVETASPKEYSKTTELLVTVKDRDSGEKTLKLTSRFQAALVVFERKFAALKKEQLKLQAEGLPPPVRGKDSFSMMIGE